MKQAPEELDRTGVREQRRSAETEGTKIRTFLIADIRGYSLFTQERGDEAAARLAATFAEVVRGCVEAGEGSLVELRGGEALAVFDSPRRAIRAAVELQSQLLEHTRANSHHPLPVGIGIDAGEAVPVQDGYRGGALNLAARLCGEAGPGEILGSQSVVHLARTIEGIDYLDRGEMHLKGMSEPVRVLAIALEGIDVAKQVAELVPPPPSRRASAGRLQFRIMGPLEVTEGDRILSLGGPKQRAVLAHLLIRANGFMSAETLVDAIWGDEARESARNTLYTYVSHLRSVLGADRIQSQAPGYRLRLDAAELDAARFEELLKDAAKARAINPRIAATVLEEALGLWRGSALADVAEDGALLAEAGRLDELRLIAGEERIDALLAMGEQSRVIAEAETLVGRHPLRERIWQQLMLALYREGRQAEALNAYQRVREILADELGIDPSPELARLHERILKQDPGLELRGEPLRGYRLLEKIDEGPTGVMFRAIQPHVGRDVAVKIYHEQLASDPSFVRRFEQEAQAAAALEHPHIVPVYDYWREPDRAYVVSRYLKGGSLASLGTRGGLFEYDRAVVVVEQIGSALAFAHGRQIAHGNVSPSNVMFDEEGNAYLGDFRVGVGATPDAADDIRGLASLTQTLLGADLPHTLAELLQGIALGSEAVDAKEIVAAVRSDTGSGAAVAAPPEADVRNPYKGLRAFNEADSDDFFGRTAVITRLLSRLGKAGDRSRFIAVVGPSGAGKSSIVRAGMVPAIRRGAVGDPEQVFVAEMFPGTHPLDELEAALLRVSTRSASRLHDLLDEGSRGLLDAMDLVLPAPAELVLVVDQFEEVFTLTTDERERELFLESLRVATADPESRLRVIVTLRADFYDRPLVYPRFGELLAAGTDVVSPLTADETEQAIRRPAEEVGINAEPGAVAEIVADVAHQPGALPLLQYALTELFERRDGYRLTLAAYQEIGGVAGALSSRADRIFASASPEAQRTIKQVFLRLVNLGEGREDTRRRVARSELDALEVDTQLVDLVVDTFGRHRLLTFDREPATREPTVEIAHEALLGAWGRLRTWIDDARDDLRQDRRLARAAGEWRGSDRDPSFLLRGSRLEQAESWASSTDLAIGKSQREYLKASLDERERELAEEEARRERVERIERRSRSRLRALVAVFAIAAVVASTLTVIAVRQRTEATRQSRVAFARELAAASVANLDVDPERSILLAMEAIDVTRSIDGTVRPEAEEALHRAVVGSRLAMSIPGVGGSLDWSPRGVFVTEGPEGVGTIDIRDAETGESVLTFPGHDGDINDVAFSPDGSMLATTGDDGELKVWDASTGRLRSTLSRGGRAWGPSFSGDSSIVAAVWNAEGKEDDAFRILDPDTDRVILEVQDPGPDSTPPNPDTAISPDGQQVVVSTVNRVAIFDIQTGDERFELHRDGSQEVSWSPDGRRIAGATNDGAIYVWDARTGETLAAAVPGVFPTSVDWSPDSELLLTGDVQGTAKVWRIGAAGGADELWSFSAHDTGSGIEGVAFSPDGKEVMIGDVNSTAVKIWDLGRSGDAEWANLPLWAWLTNVEFAGMQVVSHSGQGALTLWDPESGRPVRMFESAELSSPEGCKTPDFEVSADGQVIAADDGTGTIRGFATASSEILFTHHIQCHAGWTVSPDGDLLAVSGWDDGSVRMLDGSGAVLRTLSAPQERFREVGFSPSGQLFATSSTSGVSIWDWKREKVVSEIPGHGETLGFDGDAIATGRPDGVVELWDAQDGARLASFVGHSGGVTDVAFSPDGSRIATSGLDGTTRLFDRRTGVQQLMLEGHERLAAAFAVAFSADGSMLASYGAGWGRVWALDIDDLLAIAQTELTRSFTEEECRRYLHIDHCSRS